MLKVPLSPRVRRTATALHPTRLAQLAGARQFGLADALMLLTMLIWGINITCVKVVVVVIHPLGFGLLRYGLASCVLLAILRWQEGGIRVERGDLRWLALGGAFGFGLNQMAFLVGIRLLSASLAAIVLATAPLLTAVLAAPLAHEPIRARSLFALAISFGGVLAVIAGAGAQLQASWLGGLLILAAAATLAIAAIWAKQPLRHASSLRVTTWMALFGTGALLPLGLPALLSTPWSMLTPLLVGAATFTVLGSTVVGNLAWNYAIQQIGAARTSTYTYLQPVVGVAVAVVLLGERLSVLQVLGGVVVLLGLALYPRQQPAS